MHLRPRHYILLAIVVGIFLVNVVRHRRDSRPAVATTPAPVVITAPRVDTPAWTAFDHAAALRDAPAAEFNPALADLNHLIPHDPKAPNGDPANGDLANIKGCLTWLDFYRQGMAQTRTDPQMKARSAHHLDTCTQYHLDTTV